MHGEPLTILYQSEALVAVHKPAGMLVHRSNIDAGETRFLLQELRNQLGQHIYPVHRLDKPTSGLIVFALTPQYAANIQAQMEENHATKEYLLVCRGHCDESGEIDYPLRPIDDFRRKGKAKVDKPAQAATTRYRRLATVELPVYVDRYPTSRYSLVCAQLLTGRKHQIRRHFKHISHPIIGCPKYGKSVHNRYFAEELAAPRLLLHAWRMTLDCPLSSERLDICAPLEGSFESVVKRLGWPPPPTRIAGDTP